MTMVSYHHALSCIFLGIISTAVVSSSTPPFTPPDNYLISCGAADNVTVAGRTYLPDSPHSTLLLTSDGEGHPIQSNHSSSSLITSAIYQSLRFFTSISTYQFPIRQKGRHWVRLYFHPLPAPGFDLAAAPLTVVASGGYVLLNNFTFSRQSNPYLFKEYLLSVESGSLALTFIPANNSAAFVNGIEVVSVPDGLIPDQAVVVSSNSPFPGLAEAALETAYRVNLGGSFISPVNDTLGRTWEADGGDYLHVNSSAMNVTVDPESIRYTSMVTPEIAPNWVYASAETMGYPNVSDANFNITWVFSVDPSFSYFVRMHFCDIVSDALDILVFNVYINSDIALPSLDLSAKTGGLAVPYFKDFVANTVNGTTPDMLISIGPDMMADVKNAILNGVEVMKISNEMRSLDGLVSARNILPNSARRTKSRIGVIVGSAAGAVAALVMLGLFYFCFVIKRSKSAKPHSHPWPPLPLHGTSHTMTKGSTISLKSGTASCVSLTSASHGRIFTFQEIMDATNKFDETLLLGVGGFGKVFKGTLEDNTVVAVKRGNARSEQGLAEFHTEIEMLSKLRHRHLVSLIGYCDERSEMILVYEYMANGPLRSHLYGTDLPSLTWKQRLEICIGAARGLHYLHTGAAQSIIHRDVKTTNILLDENFVAKVADFGLSKTGPSLDKTHVSTAVKGSFGYLDPEYFRRQQLTEKSDVYSFGVVLMEVLCSRPALNPVLPREQVNIAEWAMTWQKKGLLDQIMDPSLVGNVNPASLRKYGETAEKCLADQGVERPPMGDVLWNLEYALQLEETSALIHPDENSTNHIPGIPLAPFEAFDNSISIVDGVQSGTDDDAEDAASSAVFSQLVNPRGR